MTDRVLFVCTANQCRSPMAEVMLVARLAERDAEVQVASCGLLSPGAAVVPEVTATLRRRGLDATGHRSRRLDAAVVRSADLIVGLERLHVREVVVADRESWPRAFTLKELARRARSATPRVADEPFAVWVARMHAGRSPEALLGASSADDLADPIGGPPEGYEEAATAIDELVTVLAARAWPARLT